MIDFSGGSTLSFGGMPTAVTRGAWLAAEVVFNGLVPLCRVQECSRRPVSYDLETALAGLIIGGRASFVVTADRDVCFAEAVRESCCSRSQAGQIRGRETAAWLTRQIGSLVFSWR